VGLSTDRALCFRRAVEVSVSAVTRLREGRKELRSTASIGRHSHRCGGVVNKKMNRIGKKVRTDTVAFAGI
jgi:hypothetical protein